MYYTHVDTPVGPFLLAGDDEALEVASFTTGRQHREPRDGWLRLAGDEGASAVALGARQLEEYFARERTSFDVPLRVRGSAFQKAVWEQLRDIPFGQTRSYGEIAEALGRSGASRAVGGANGANVLPIFIPCHRVIGQNGTLTGFGGGLETKRWLLEFEGALADNQQRLF